MISPLIFQLKNFFLCNQINGEEKKQDIIIIMKNGFFPYDNNVIRLHNATRIHRSIVVFMTESLKCLININRIKATVTAQTLSSSTLQTVAKRWLLHLFSGNDCRLLLTKCKNQQFNYSNFLVPFNSCDNAVEPASFKMNGHQASGYIIYIIIESD